MVAGFDKQAQTAGVVDAVRKGDFAAASAALATAAKGAKQVQVVGTDFSSLYQQTPLDYQRLAAMEAAMLEGEGYVVAANEGAGALAVATPIKLDDQIQAVAYALMPAKSLFDAAKQVEVDDRSYLGLRMGNIGVVEHGDSLLASSSEARRDPIAHSRFTVVSMAPDAMPGPFGLGLIGCLVGALGLLLAGFGALLTPKALARKTARASIDDSIADEPTLAEQIASEAMLALSEDVALPKKAAKPRVVAAGEGEEGRAKSGVSLASVDPALEDAEISVLGQVIGGWLDSQDIASVAVGHDEHGASAGVLTNLVAGLVAAGRKVYLLGQVPAPVIAFAGEHLKAGASIAAIAADSGKIELRVVVEGKPLTGDALDALGAGQAHRGEDGSEETVEVMEAYLTRLTENSDLGRQVCVGVSGPYSGHLARALELHGVRVSDGVDAEFAVRLADNGTAIFVSGSHGEMLLPQQVLKLLAGDLLDRAPGSEVILNEEAAKSLATHVIAHGGNAKVAGPGVAQLHTAMVEHGALLGGDLDGHILFGDAANTGADGFQAALRLVDLLSYVEHADEILGA